MSTKSFKWNDPSTWKLSPEAAYKVRSATTQLRSADRILNILWRAQGGGAASLAMAGFSMIDLGIEAISPTMSPADLVRELGFVPINSDLGEFICDKLIKSNLERRSMALGATRVIFWGEGIAAIYAGDEYQYGPFVKEGVDLAETVSPLIWSAGDDLMLSIERNADNGKVYRTLTMPEPGMYIGEMGVDWLASRLEKREGSRSIILIGPSGVGKTTLARLVARKLGGGRALKVTSQVMRSCSANSLLDIVRYLRPKVLLLDDVQGLLRAESRSGRYPTNAPGSTTVDYEDFLSTMEALHGESSLIIGTLMDDSVQGGTQRNGADYFSGMRPGRVDEIIWIKRPEFKDRRKILSYYINSKVDRKVMSDIVNNTRGLTGAYLKEVANRVNIYGLDTWKNEVKAIKYAAPEIPKRGSRSVRAMSKLQQARRETRAAKRLRIEAQEESFDSIVVKLAKANNLDLDDRAKFNSTKWLEEKEAYINEILTEASGRDRRATKLLEEHNEDLDDIEKEITALKKSRGKVLPMARKV